MNSPFHIPRKLRLVFSKLGSLLLLFQRTPIVQMILPEARVMGTTGVAEIVKWSVATVAGLGVYDTVAGATTMTQIAPLPVVTPITATTGKSMSLTVQVTGAPGNPGSWQIIGTLPTGINKTSSGSTCTLSGTPTNSGSFPFTIKAWENSGNSGGSVSKAFTISVASGAVAPSITSNPSSVTINSGSTTTLTVTASGTSPSFQWYIGNAGNTANPVSGATSASFTTPALSSTTTYWAKASNTAGSANSTAATVTVRIPPSFTTNPVSTSINSGGTTTLTVAASGTSPTFQWYRGNAGITTSPISGATSSTFTTPSLTTDTTYWVKASNAAGTANSTAATVSIRIPPSIATPPASTTVDSGSTANLSVIAAGTSPTFQWYIGDSGNISNPIAGATSASYTTPSLSSATTYWVRATNPAGSADSAAATVSVAIVAPVITSPPASVTILSGATATLSVAASGTSPSFQWYVGNKGDIANPISGATSATFTTPSLTTAATYWVRASNISGDSDSDAATVTIDYSIVPLITSQPSPVTINSGETTTLTIAASGTSPAFQWYVGITGDVSQPIAGATSDTFTTPALTASTNYWARAHNNAGNADSDTATVTVVTPPSITTQPVSKTIKKGTTTTLAVVATGTSPAYQWYLGSTGVTANPVSGATSASFTTPVLNAATSYWVRVSNTASSVDSSTVTVNVALPPVISKPQAPMTIKKGTSATLSIGATGTALTYQWYVGKSGVTKKPFFGAKSATFKTPALLVTTTYWVRVKNAVGFVNSKTITVTVLGPGGLPTGHAAATGVVPQPGTFEEWQVSQFNSAQLAVPSISGPDADPDGDGVVNQNEYVFGSLPLTAEPPPAPVIVNLNGQVSVSFIAKSASGPGYAGRTRHYALEATGDLNGGSWTVPAGYGDVIGNNRSFSYQDAAAGRFYRLRIWLTP